MECVISGSRIRVYQLTSLVTKLAPEIVDYLVEHNDDITVRRFFTERRLRPLTRLDLKEEQILVRFGEMVEAAAS